VRREVPLMSGAERGIGSSRVETQDTVAADAAGVVIALRGHVYPVVGPRTGKGHTFRIRAAGAVGISQQLSRTPVVRRVGSPDRAVPAQPEQRPGTIANRPDHARGRTTGPLIDQAAHVAAEDARAIDGLNFRPSRPWERCHFARAVVGGALGGR